MKTKFRLFIIWILIFFGINDVRVFATGDLVSGVKKHYPKVTNSNNTSTKLQTEEIPRANSPEPDFISIPPELLKLDFLKKQRIDTAKIKIELIKTFYKSQTKAYNYRNNLFDFQLDSGKTLFYVVIIMVFIGLYFSYLQFRTALGKNIPETTVDLSFKNIRITSSVIGLIILVVSLAFLYLYLYYVYPITELKLNI